MKEIERFLLRPRYLRAIPSLVVLTTAMAWAVLPDLDTSDELSKKPGVSLMQPTTQAADGAAFGTVMLVKRQMG